MSTSKTGYFSLTSCAALVITMVCSDVAAATSLLTLGPRGVQTWVVEQLFIRSGRWYLLDDGGICYTYLDSPHTHFESDRLVLNTHLTSRMGQRVGNNCAGVDLTSNVVLSGKLHGAGHDVLLDDIRIDRVDDDATRNALNVALQLAPDTIPRAATLDVLDLVRKQLAAYAMTHGMPLPHLDQLHIVDITTRSASVTIAFDLSLSLP